MKSRINLVVFILLISLLLIPVSFASDLSSNQDNIDNSILNAQTSELEGSVEEISSNESISDSDSISDSESIYGSDESSLDSDSISDSESIYGSDESGLDCDDAQDSILEDDDYSIYSNDAVRQADLDTSFAHFDSELDDSNIIYVNSSYDGELENGTRLNPYKSIETGFNSLFASSNTKSILFIANGVYDLNDQIKFYTNRNSVKNYTIIGESSLNTILNGNEGIFYINGYASSIKTVNIFNLTLANGHYHSGGAIYSTYTYLNLINLIFKDNSAEVTSGYDAGYGGAIYNDKGFLKIYGCSFINNSVSGSYNQSKYGGAIYTNLGELSIFHSQFINSSVTARYGSGGAIYNFNGYMSLLNVSILNSTVNSTFSLGGAICNWNSRNTYMINSTIAGNVLNGTYTFGSAIANKGLILDIVNSTVSNNSANGNSSLNSTIFNMNGYFNFTNSIFENNSIKSVNPDLVFCMEDQLTVSNLFDSSYDDFIDYEILGNLPSSYDLRDYGLVTAVHDQGNSGSCWTFATYAALESYLLKYENVSYDFSENHMKNVMGYGENGVDWDDGGNIYVALAYLLRGSGPVDESLDPYVASSSSSPEILDTSMIVTDALYIPLRLGYLDNSQIKYAIMKYGALFTALYSGGMRTSSSYYNVFPESSTHAVAIVGWDDDYSRTNFRYTPPGDGAFIIKNSWGTSSSSDGYWYVSYYDPIFAGAYETVSAMAFTNVENLSEYKTIYQYDLLGNTFESLGYNCDTAWFANQFTAESNSPLKAFGIYTFGSSSYLVNITVNGISKLIQEGNISGAGYHTIKLNDYIDLAKGDKFRINVRLTTPDSLFPIAIESQRSGYSSKASAEANQSFISKDGVNWVDLTVNRTVVKFFERVFRINLAQTNVCLKAYTGFADELSLEIRSNSSYYLAGDLIQFNISISNNGDPSGEINISSILDDSVTVISYDASIGIFDELAKVWTIGNLDNGDSGKLILSLMFNEKKQAINTSVSVNSASYSFNKNLFKSSIVEYATHTEFIKISNVNTTVKSGKYVTFTLIDGFNNILKDKNITLKLISSNNNYSMNPVILNTNNGSLKYALNLLAGKYKFMVMFDSDGYYDSSNATFEVNVVKTATKLIASNLNATTVVKSIDGKIGKYLKMTLKDANGNVLSGKTVVFTLNKTKYTLKTNKSGVARLQINVATAGTYTFKLNFVGDEKFTASSKTVKVYVKKQSLKLTAPKKTYRLRNKKKYLTATLKNSKGKAIKNKKITITVNGKKYTGKTNSKGVVKVKVSLSKRKTYKFTVKFAGDKSYKAVSKTAKVVVKR